MVTSVEVLSNPSLVVINNQVATLQVGDVVPVSTGKVTVLTSNNTVVNTIDYRNTGIILRVSPRVSMNGNVRLDIEQEISNVPATSANSLTPTVSERRVEKPDLHRKRPTVPLAGLISEQQNGTRNAIPVLDQISGLGDAFGHQSNSTQRTELIIFIRPQIIRDGSDAHVVAEELRSRVPRQHRHDIDQCTRYKQLPLSEPSPWFAGASGGPCALLGLLYVGASTIAARADELSRGTAAFYRGDYGRALRDISAFADRDNARALGLLGSPRVRDRVCR